ncbi:MAG TPA: AAA family ATPase, partial [Rhodospirillum rubrum]|nr:AAA family ATPase [Rhodospirillum rubrum]
MGEAHSLAERYELLLDVSEILELNRDLNSLLGALCDLPASIGLFDYVNLLLYDAPTDTMTLFSQGDVGGGYARIDGLAPTEGPGQVVWARQRPFVCSGEEYRRHFLKIAALRRNQRVGLYCQMPLTTSQRRLGGVEFISSRPTTYDEDDLTFLRRVASVIAISVENALIGEMRQMEEERLRGERDHNHILVEVTNAVISKLKLEDLVDEVSRSIHRFFGVDFVSLDLVDPATATIKSRSVYFQKGLGPVWGSAQGPLGASPMAPLFETKAPRILARADLGALARGHDQMTLLTNAGFQVACGIPLLSAGHVLGVLTLASRERDKFTDYNIGLLGEVASRICIAVENALAYGEISRLKDQLSRENKQLAKERYYLEEEIRRTEDFGDIIGISPAIRGVLEQVELVADSDSTVLILGETGTGKELIARAIHMLSQRKKRTMIKVNCAAIPSALLESDLFGHEKGAFTGAIAQKSGRFELADRGTLFLDE